MEACERRALPRTLAEVLTQIADDNDLPETRRRNVCSALRMLAKAVAKDLHELSAQPGAIRPLLRDFHPARLNMTVRRWRNIKSDVLFGLRRVSLEPVPGRRPGPLLPEWQQLYGWLPGHKFKSRLSRLMSYCSAKGIRPEEVCDEVASEFLEALVERSFLRNPAEIHREACLRWNEAIGKVPGWPQIRLCIPDRRKAGLPWNAFPPSLREEMQAWLDALSGEDPFDEATPDKPLRPATLRTRRSLIRTVATALVRSGRDPGTITSLRDLVEPAAFKAALRVLYEEQGRRKTLALHQKAHQLRAIARHWVQLDERQLEELSRVCRNLSPRDCPKGLSPKNRDRLRPLMDPLNARRLMRWPQERAREIETNDTGGRQEAVDFQIALAAEILLFAPVRLQNLRTINLDYHLCWSRPGRNGIVHLVFPAEEVKNDEALAFELVPETVRMLKLYLRKYRQRLLHEPSLWLFPGTHGRAKSAVTLANQISEAVLEGTGFRMTTHLFRHFCAIQYLKRNPGQYEVVRRLLGHRSLVAIRYYTGLENEEAVRHYHSEILKLRHEWPQAEAKRR